MDIFDNVLAGNADQVMDELLQHPHVALARHPTTTESVLTMAARLWREPYAIDRLLKAVEAAANNIGRSWRELLNAPNYHNGDTPLLAAVRAGRKPVVEFLTTKRVHDLDIGARNWAGQSALDLARRARNKGLVRLVLFAQLQAHGVQAGPCRLVIVGCGLTATLLLAHLDAELTRCVARLSTRPDIVVIDTAAESGEPAFAHDTTLAAALCGWPRAELGIGPSPSAWHLQVSPGEMADDAWRVAFLATFGPPVIDRMLWSAALYPHLHDVAQYVARPMRDLCDVSRMQYRRHVNHAYGRLVSADENACARPLLSVRPLSIICGTRIELRLQAARRPEPVPVSATHLVYAPSAAPPRMSRVRAWFGSGLERTTLLPCPAATLAALPAGHLDIAAFGSGASSVNAVMTMLLSPGVGQLQRGGWHAPLLYHCHVPGLSVTLYSDTGRYPQIVRWHRYGARSAEIGPDFALAFRGAEEMNAAAAVTALSRLMAEHFGLFVDHPDLAPPLGSRLPMPDLSGDGEAVLRRARALVRSDLEPRIMDPTPPFGPDQSVAEIWVGRMLRWMRERLKPAVWTEFCDAYLDKVRTSLVPISPITAEALDAMHAAGVLRIRRVVDVPHFTGGGRFQLDYVAPGTTTPIRHAQHDWLIVGAEIVERVDEGWHPLHATRHEPDGRVAGSLSEVLNDPVTRRVEVQDGRVVEGGIATPMHAIGDFSACDLLRWSSPWATNRRCAALARELVQEFRYAADGEAFLNEPAD